MENKDKKIKEFEEEKAKETLNEFEEIGEANFGIMISKINWWKILTRVVITLLIVLVSVLILK